MNYGCIALRLGHSFSKTIHEKIGGYDYILKEIAEDELDSFMKSKNFKGINVTIPYKERVIPYLDYISDTAKKIGAVNTVVNKGGMLYGYNTDYLGMKQLIEKNGIAVKGKKVVIAGTGGTSKTAFAVCESLGAKNIIKASRSGKENAATYEEIYKFHNDAEIIINTTPCGMFPDNGAVPLNIRAFKNIEAVIDAIYNPLSSRLVLEAKELGAKASGGLYMLIAQAVYAAEFFTGRKYDKAVTDGIYSDISKDKLNIVLTGMPGSGKSTIGKITAQKLGKTFVDTDELIIKKDGRQITEIFEKSGEKYFRDIEEEVIREISAKNGLVISTGGGAVLRKTNTDNLKQNGLIFFIDRPLSGLMPTDDRPLADSREKIERLYNERMPVYLSRADKKIAFSDWPADNAEKIIKVFNEVLKDENTCN